MTKEMGFCNNGNKRKRNGGTSAADLSSFPALFLPGGAGGDDV
jgi:hypothetical protein